MVSGTVLVETKVDVRRFPLHLHPRNKDLDQLLQMMAKMVSDLELDSPFPDLPVTTANESKRTYLGCYYIAST
jgi:hypothetical protein